MNKKIKISILAVLTLLFISISQEVSDGFLNTEFSALNCCFIVLYYFLFKNTFAIKDKRAKKCCIVLAVMFAMFEIFGYSISKYQNLSCVIGSKMVFLKATLKFIGYCMTFYSVLLLVFTKLFPQIKKIKDKKMKYFTANKKSFLIIALIIFLCYLPTFISEYPGIISTDSISEMSTSLYSMDNMVNHHPVTHIAIISIFMNIGKLLGSYNLGIALYSIFQMICTALTFSFVIYYMAKKNVNFYIRMICFIIFAIYPPFAYYSITMWKDVLFGLVMLIFTICMIEIAINKEFLTKIKNKVFLALTMIAVILLRNNGFYVVLISIPFMIYFCKNSRKIMSIISVSVVSFYFIFKGPIFAMLNIKPGPIREALSVPVQQIARSVKYKGDKLTDEEKAEISKYLPVDKIGELYYPYISDNVKDTLNNDAVEKNKLDFVGIWIKLFFKCPKEYIESFLSGSLGYWYPEEKNWVIWESNEEYQIGSESLDIDIYKSDTIGTNISKNIIHYINHSSKPVLSGIFSIGLTFWGTITMLTYVIYKRKYRMILVYIPILALWLTTIASPVWCEYRYIYGLFTCAPILIIAMPEMIKDNYTIRKKNV